MPTIFGPKDLAAAQKEGRPLTTLADAAMLGTDALQVERLALEPHATAPVFEAVNAERFLHVIRGGGGAQVGERAFPLERESILWIEADDPYALKSGAEGLETLVCRTPAGG